MEKNESTFFSPTEDRCLLAGRKNYPEEREFVVDCGASDAHDKHEGFEFRRIGNRKDSENSHDGCNSQWWSADQWGSCSVRQRIGFILDGTASRGYASSIVAGKPLRGPQIFIRVDQWSPNHISLKIMENYVPIVVLGLTTGSSPSSSSTTQLRHRQRGILKVLPNPASPRCEVDRYGGNPLHSDVPEWLQEFRENPVDERGSWT